jgi:hypothetical protein
MTYRLQVYIDPDAKAACRVWIQITSLYQSQGSETRCRPEVYVGMRFCSSPNTYSAGPEMAAC